MKYENKTPPPTFERTEQLVNEVGNRIGRWAGRVVRRMQHTARSLSQESKRMEPEVEHRETPTTRPTMQRAEDLVDHLGQRATYWGQRGGMRLRRAAAHLREDMEDMWIEVKTVQSQFHEKPHTEIHEEC